MGFKDRDEKVMAYRNGYVFTHSHEGIAKDSLNTSLRQKSKDMVLLTTVLKILSYEISCQRLPNTCKNHNANLTENEFAKYFLPLGGDIKEAISNL